MEERKYLTDFPELMKEFDWEANEGIDPSKISHGSNKKVWWKCLKGHKWEAIVRNRVRGYNCPYCTNKKLLKGFNDLATAYPKVAKEWNYKKNNTLPTEVLYGSAKKVWWKCSLGHEWEAKVHNRIYGHSCPYCTGRKILKGFNDLATLFPEIIKEWDYEKNNDLKPNKMPAHSSKKVHWICKEGHRWIASISSRTKKNGTYCPYCSRGTSLPEFAIEYYLKQLNRNVIHGYRKLGFELDLFLPDLNIGIEYDGYVWHKNRVQKDLEKNKKCQKLGIKLYRIRENLNSLNSSSIDIVYDSNKESLSIPIKKIINQIYPNHNLKIDYERDILVIRKLKGDCSIFWRRKLITICNITRDYSTWSLNLGYDRSYVGRIVRKYGLKEATNWLTKIYKGKILNNKPYYTKKSIEINGITKNYSEWTLYFGYKRGYVADRIRRYGLEATIKYLTDMYNGKIHPKKHVKYITISNTTKTYSQWSFYFGHSRNYVSGIIKKHGLEETVKYLTKLYREKQSKEKDVA